MPYLLDDVPAGLAAEAVQRLDPKEDAAGVLNLGEGKRSGTLAEEVMEEQAAKRRRRR
jgi:hypothetical protein